MPTDAARTRQGPCLPGYSRPSTGEHRHSRSRARFCPQPTDSASIRPPRGARVGQRVCLCVGRPSPSRPSPRCLLPRQIRFAWIM
jgi:hypothetical protein